MTVYACDTASLQAKLSDYDKKWRSVFGEAGWNLLENSTGKHLA
jgi:hypothetical protein